MTYLSSRQRLDPLLLIGIAVSVLLHGSLAASMLIDSDGGRATIEVPRDFVVAKMVRLGRKRPKNFLPVIPPRRKPTAPKRHVGLTRNEHAAPSRKRPEKEIPNAQEGKALRRAKNLAELFAKAQKEIEAEGDPSGSPFGTATEASPGDAYATACAEAIQEVWTVPPAILLSDAVLARLTAEVRVIIGPTGRVYQAKIKEPSKNRYFDASLTDALGRLKRLPRPPAGLMRGHPRVGIILLFEGKDLQR